VLTYLLICKLAAYLLSGCCKVVMLSAMPSVTKMIATTLPMIEKISSKIAAQFYDNHIITITHISLIRGHQPRSR